MLLAVALKDIFGLCGKRIICPLLEVNIVIRRGETVSSNGGTLISMNCSWSWSGRRADHRGHIEDIGHLTRCRMAK